MIVVGVLSVTVVAVGGLTAGVLAFLGSTEPARMALLEVNGCDPCRDAIGTPIEAGWYAIGQVNWDNSSGNAALRIPVSGPRGEGTLGLEATRSGGEWRFKELVLEIPKTEERYVLWHEGRNVSPSGDNVAEVARFHQPDIAAEFAHGEEELAAAEAELPVVEAH